MEKVLYLCLNFFQDKPCPRRYGNGRRYVQCVVMTLDRRKTTVQDFFALKTLKVQMFSHEVSFHESLVLCKRLQQFPVSVHRQRIKLKALFKWFQMPTVHVLPLHDYCCGLECLIRTLEWTDKWCNSSSCLCMFAAPLLWGRVSL